TPPYRRGSPLVCPPRRACVLITTLVDDPLVSRHSSGVCLQRASGNVPRALLRAIPIGRPACRAIHRVSGRLACSSSPGRSQTPPRDTPGPGSHSVDWRWLASCCWPIGRRVLVLLGCAVMLAQGTASHPATRVSVLKCCLLPPLLPQSCALPFVASPSAVG